VLKYSIVLKYRIVLNTIVSIECIATEHNHTVKKSYLIVHISSLTNVAVVVRRTDIMYDS